MKQIVGSGSRIPYWNTFYQEIHAGYKEKKYELIAQKGYLTYDFFLPGLLPDDRIEDLIRLLVERGGFAKRYRVRP